MKKERLYRLLKNPIVYLFGSIIYLELLMRFNIIKSFGLGLVFIVVFGLSFSLLFYFLSHLAMEKINKKIFGFILGLLGLYFSIQMVYYDFFKVFLTIYSIGSGGQVAEFYKDIIQLIIQNILWIILCFIPFIAYISYFHKKLIFERINRKKAIIYLGSMVISFICGYAFLYIPSSSLNTPLDIYNETMMSESSVKQLGMMTSLRLDIQSIFFHKDGNNEIIDEVIIPKPQEIVYDSQVMDIDFDKLIQNSTNNTIKNMHKYFKNVTPTKKNKYTGMFKDYNMILLTCESFSPYAIDKELTPTLYRLYNEGFQFTNFYTPLWHVSTSDGEYVALQGLIPKSGVWSFKKSSNNDLPFTLGKQYQKLGYTTKGYHNHSYTYYGRNLSHPNLGYNFKAVGHGLNIKKQWPESDLEMMQKTVDDYITKDKFHTYYMTVSGHPNYTYKGNNMAGKNKKYVDHLDYTDLAKGYLATQIELDRALEYLVKRLEDAGIADKTVIALSADHYPYSLPIKNYNELAGHKLEKNFELYENSFLIWSGSMKEPIVVDKVGSSLDIVPTLSNLLGLEYDSRLLMGTDLLSDSDPLVIFENKSFITDKVMYDAKNDKAKWLNDNQEDQDYLKRINKIVKQKFEYSKKILENNYYKHVFNESQ